MEINKKILNKTKEFALTRNQYGISIEELDTILEWLYNEKLFNEDGIAFAKLFQELYI